jgi:AP-2 complex subunit alpha
LLKKAEDAEVDTAEQSAIKLRSQQQTSSALVVADQHPANGSAPVTNHLTLVKMPSQTISDNQEMSLIYEEGPKPPIEVPKENGAPFDVESKTTNVPDVNVESKAEPPTPHSASPAGLLADLLGPLAIEGPPPVEQHPTQGLEANQSSVGDLALATLEDQSNSVQVLVYSYFLYLGCILIQHFLKDRHTIPAILFYGDVFSYLHLPNEFCYIQPIINVEEKFHILCTKDSGVLYEDPHVQVCIITKHN